MMAAKPMRLLVVIPGLGTGGGTERSLLEFVPKLVSTGIDVSIAYMVQRPTGIEDQFQRAGAHLHHITEHRMGGRIRGVRRVIAVRRPHIVHTMLYEADIAGRLAAWRVPGCCPVVLSSIVSTSYDPARLADPNVRPWKLHAVRSVDGWTARNLTDHFHAVSNAVKDAAVQMLGIDANRVTVVQRGRDPGRLGEPSRERRARVRAALGLDLDAKVVVTVGRQEFPKSQVDLVSAFDRLAGSRPDAQLLLVGRAGSQSQALSARIDRSVHRDRIRTLGYRDDVPDLLAASDVFALPSLYEGFPAAVIEAMALALPVIASRIPVLHEVVEDERSGLLVPPRNPERLAEAISRVLDDPAENRGLGERGRELFLARFTAEQSHRRMIDVYERLVSA
jgi:glycosyltransferase involved in cell wall biosynthesis